MHTEAMDGFKKMLVMADDQTRGKYTRDDGDGLLVLDLGGRDVNGTVHDLLPRARWKVLDIVDDEGVDFVADARSWRSDVALYDLIVSTEMLEHVQGWAFTVATMWYHLAPNGYVIITCASDGRRPHGASGAMWPEPDEYYDNVSPGMLDATLDLFFDGKATVYNPNPGDLYALACDPIPRHKLSDRALELLKGWPK